MSAKPHGQIDPEEAMQEHGDWFTDVVMWCFSYAPVLPLAIYCVAMAMTAIGIVIHHFTR